MSTVWPQTKEEGGTKEGGYSWKSFHFMISSLLFFPLALLCLLLLCPFYVVPFSPLFGLSSHNVYMIFSSCTYDNKEVTQTCGWRTEVTGGVYLDLETGHQQSKWQLARPFCLLLNPQKHSSNCNLEQMGGMHFKLRLEIICIDALPSYFAWIMDPRSSCLQSVGFDIQNICLRTFLKDKDCFG